MRQPLALPHPLARRFLLSLNLLFASRLESRPLLCFCAASRCGRITHSAVSVNSSGSVFEPEYRGARCQIGSGAGASSALLMPSSFQFCQTSCKSIDLTQFE